MLFQMLPIQSPFPKIGGSQHPLKTAIWLSYKIVGKFAQLYASSVGSKNVAQKNVLSGGISFCGVLTGKRALKRSPSL